MDDGRLVEEISVIMLEPLSLEVAKVEVAESLE